MCWQIKKIDATSADKKGEYYCYLYHVLPTDRYRVNEIDATEKCVQKMYKKKKKNQPHQAWISPDVEGGQNSGRVGVADEDRLLMDRRRPMAVLRDDEDWVVPNRPMAAVWDDLNGDRRAGREGRRMDEAMASLEDAVVNTRAQTPAQMKQLEKAGTEVKRLLVEVRAKLGEETAEKERALRLVAHERAAREAARRNDPPQSAQRLHDNPQQQADIGLHTGVGSYELWRAIIAMFRVYYPAGITRFRDVFRIDSEALQAEIDRNTRMRCPTEVGYMSTDACIAASMAGRRPEDVMDSVNRAAALEQPAGTVTVTIVRPTADTKLGATVKATTVERVTDRGAAATAGLKVGDKIVMVDQVRTNTFTGIKTMLGRAEPTVVIMVLRQQQRAAPAPRAAAGGGAVRRPRVATQRGSQAIEIEELPSVPPAAAAPAAAAAAYDSDGFQIDDY